MNVLIIGYSYIVQKRVLPALASLSEIDRIFIASRRQLSPDIIPSQKRGGVYQGYENAISLCEPCLAYISLPQNLHAEWANRALDAGFHVVVDKPSVTILDDAKSLIEKAERKKLCFAEASVWHYHPMAQALKSLIDKEENKPLSYSAMFSSPPMDPGAFRFKPELGSGTLLDRGPYAISTGRFFIGEAPGEIVCRVVEPDMVNEVDISFHMMMTYPCGSVVQGFFSLGAEYRNNITVIGTSYCFEVDRIYTPPADYNSVINVTRKNKKETIAASTGDSFALFILDVLKSIRGQSYERLSGTLLEDAQVLNDLLTAAKKTS